MITTDTFPYTTATDLLDDSPTIPELDRTALLQDIANAIRDRDSDGLIVALGMAPFNCVAYADRLKALLRDDASPEEVEQAQIDALKASAQPEGAIDDALADAILNAMTAWHAITTETPEQRAIRETFAEARRLIDLHGDDDPRVFDAIIKAIELQDPGVCNRKLKECGLQLLAPTYCDADGAPLYSLEQVAQALDADPEDLLPYLKTCCRTWKTWKRPGWLYARSLQRGSSKRGARHSSNAGDAGRCARA